MELHSLLGVQPRSIIIESALLEIARNSGDSAVVPVPTVKVYKDAVYYSYHSLGISLNYEPSIPLVPSAYTAKGKDAAAPEPDPSLLKLVAIHLYRSPVDKFQTFPLSFLVHGDTVGIEMGLEKKAFEVVQLLGEPEQRVGGGRQGSCWIGYQKSIGLAVDFVGSNWDDRDMSSLLGLYYLFITTTKNLSPGNAHERMDLNGEGEPMDLTQDSSQHGDKASQKSPIVTLEKRIQGLIDTHPIMVFSKTYCPYSMAAKKLLRSYTSDIHVLEVDLEQDDADIKKVLTKIAHGHSTFPSIFFKGESIGGRDNLQALDDAGKLQPQLELLGVSMLN
ncbi:hypothetical protein BGX26_001309 [Mortierella sp. AD094]|nr:hypothetical protein BGX26_001309 [Mortierella sp. AD094]